MRPKWRLCPECRGEGGYCDTCEGRGRVKVPQYYNRSASVAGGGISEYSSLPAHSELEEDRRRRYDPHDDVDKS